MCVGALIATESCISAGVGWCARIGRDKTLNGNVQCGVHAVGIMCVRVCMNERTVDGVCVCMVRMVRMCDEMCSHMIDSTNSECSNTVYTMFADML